MAKKIAEATIDADTLKRISYLYAHGYLSLQHFRPRAGDWVYYDLLFMVRRLFGNKRVEEINFEVDGSPSMIDAALLTGTAPGMKSIFWRLQIPEFLDRNEIVNT